MSRKKKKTRDLLVLTSTHLKQWPPPTTTLLKNKSPLQSKRRMSKSLLLRSLKILSELSTRDMAALAQLNRIQRVGCLLLHLTMRLDLSYMNLRVCQYTATK